MAVGHERLVAKGDALFVVQGAPDHAQTPAIVQRLVDLSTLRQKLGAIDPVSRSLFSGRIGGNPLGERWCGHGQCPVNESRPLKGQAEPNYTKSTQSRDVIRHEVGTSDTHVQIVVGFAGIALNLITLE